MPLATPVFSAVIGQGLSFGARLVLSNGTSLEFGAAQTPEKFEFESMTYVVLVISP